MPRLTWKDGDTHEFIVIGKVAGKRHWNNRQKRFIPCTGRRCWYCNHPPYDYQGVVIGIAIYSPEEIEGTHFPWVSFTPNAYRAIRQVLGVSKNWYGHRIQLTRKGLGLNTTYTAKDLGVVESHKLEAWEREREEAFKFDAGEEWGAEEGPGEETPGEEVVLERASEPEEDKEGRLVYLEELLASVKTEIEELKGEE